MVKQKQIICAHIECNKKINLTQQIIGKCRCNNIYCTTHRLPEAHDCSYNYFIEKEKFINDNKCVACKLESTICSSEH